MGKKNKFSIVGTLKNNVQIKNTRVVCNRMITTVRGHLQWATLVTHFL